MFPGVVEKCTYMLWDWPIVYLLVFVRQSAGVVEVIDNLLDWVNLAGFEDLQAGAPGSQSVLNNAERYALYLATALSQNGSERDILLSRQNIGEAIVL